MGGVRNFDLRAVQNPETEENYHFQQSFKFFEKLVLRIKFLVQIIPPNFWQSIFYIFFKKNTSFNSKNNSVEIFILKQNV